MEINPQAPSLLEITKELEAAAESYRAASENERLARNTTTDSLNRLNRAQKAFDTAVSYIRQSAPRASNWMQEKKGLGALAPVQMSDLRMDQYPPNPTYELQRTTPAVDPSQPG